jgi:4-hydroxyphenylacetate 3-monooxygenase
MANLFQNKAYDYVRDEDSTMIRTGNEYKDSIRGNREVYMDGKRVNDVTTHAMFKPLVDIRARIYDMAHEEATRDIMTTRDGDEVNAIGNALPFTQQDWWDKRRATDAVLEDVGGVVTRVGDETVGEMWSLYDGQDVLNGLTPNFQRILKTISLRS